MVTNVTFSGDAVTDITMQMKELPTDEKKSDRPRIYFRLQHPANFKLATKRFGGYQSVCEQFAEWFLSLDEKKRFAFLRKISATGETVGFDDEESERSHPPESKSKKGGKS